MEDVDMTHQLRHILSRRSFISYLLLVVVLFTVSFGLSITILKINKLLLVVISIVGLSYGWSCAISRLKDWHVALLTLFLGITSSIFYFAQLVKPMGALLRSILSASLGLLNWRTEGASDLSSIHLAIQQMNTLLETFINRILQWTEKLQSGQVWQDELIISMLWSLAFWLVAVWASWLIFRYHSALVSIIPACGILAGSLNYVGGNPLYLIPLIGSTLILIALTNYDQQESYWVKNKIDYAEDIRLDLGIAIFLLTLGFLVTSAFAPSISIQQIINASQKITQRYQVRIDSIAKSLGLTTQSRESNPFSSIRHPGLPRSHLLGSGPEISKEIVMVIETGDYSPVQSTEDLPSIPPNYYWRSTIYDVYTGVGWTTSEVEVINYSADQPAIEGLFPITGTVSLNHNSVQMTQDLGGLIFSAGQLISLDKDYQVAWRLYPEDNVNDGKEDRIVDEFGATFEGSTYTVESFINSLNITQLRSTSGDIPTWIQVRYLALPEHLSTRVQQLAQSLTEDQRSNYDKAAAIESYLRTIPYSLDIPSPPSDQDVVDYFLFDLKEGYCDYYATAMVVMARAIGLPARLVTGYAAGTYDPITARYYLSEANAHSWVEVYLAGIGWVEFEPTGGLPALQRNNEEVSYIEIPHVKQVQKFSLYNWLRSIHQNWMAIISAVIGVLILGIIMWIASDRWRLYRLSPSMAIVRLYLRLYNSSKPLAVDFQIGDTPYEYSARVKQQLIMSISPKRWKSFFQPGGEEIAQLTNLYSRVIYSPHVPVLGDKVAAINIWYHLRKRLWIALRLASLNRLLSKIKAVANRK